MSGEGWVFLFIYLFTTLSFFFHKYNKIYIELKIFEIISCLCFVSAVFVSLAGVSGLKEQNASCCLTHTSLLMKT